MTMLTQNRRDRIHLLLEAFNKLMASSRASRMAQMQTLLSTVSTHAFRKTGFNALSVCCVGTYEVRHSAILAWMLDPTGGHGQGNLFLDTFLMAADIPCTAGNIRTKVRTEYCVSEAIVDIIVYQRERLLVYIENKVLASEGDDQIDREFRDMRKLGLGLHVPDSLQFAVFLTPDGRKPTSGDASKWKTLSYPALANAIGDVLTESMDVKVRGFVQDWIETVQTWRIADDDLF